MTSRFTITILIALLLIQAVVVQPRNLRTVQKMLKKNAIAQQDKTLADNTNTAAAAAIPATILADKKNCNDGNKGNKGQKVKGNKSKKETYVQKTVEVPTYEETVVKTYKTKTVAVPTHEESVPVETYQKTETYVPKTYKQETYAPKTYRQETYVPKTYVQSYPKETYVQSRQYSPVVQSYETQVYSRAAQSYETNESGQDESGYSQGYYVLLKKYHGNMNQKNSHQNRSRGYGSEEYSDRTYRPSYHESYSQSHESYSPSNETYRYESY